MPLLFKLVVRSTDNKNYEVRDDFSGPVNLKLIKELFKFWSFTDEEFSKIKFITESVQMTNPDQDFMVSPDEDKIIYIFSSDPDIRQKLLDIFIKNGNEVIVANQQQTTVKTAPTQPSVPDPEICQPVTEVKPDETPVLTPDIIELMNVQSTSLFADSDFKNLIGIYLRRPMLFNTLAKYVQHGDIIPECLCPTKNISELTEEEQALYQSLADKIVNLELGFEREYIIQRLIKFSGHLNLTVRSLLCETVNVSHSI